MEKIKLENHCNANYELVEAILLELIGTDFRWELRERTVEQYAQRLYKAFETQKENVLSDDIVTILSAGIQESEFGSDGRSHWKWFRDYRGDLIFGCYPQGELYFETEVNRNV